MQKIQIQIPTDFTIQHYQQIGQFEHLTEIQKVVRIISIISNHSVEEIERWDLASIKTIYSDLNERILNVEPIFLPIFEFKGIKYGLQPISKMSVGEYIDLEKNLTEGNILEVMSIIYRPIIKDNLDSFTWKVRNKLRFIQGKNDILFKKYTVEDYDIETREWRKDLFKELPLSVALGAYNFFLLIELQYSNYTLQSSHKLSQEEKKEIQKMMGELSENIGAGSYHSTISQAMEAYLDLQENEKLQE